MNKYHREGVDSHDYIQKNLRLIEKLSEFFERRKARDECTQLVEHQ